MFQFVMLLPLQTLLPVITFTSGCLVVASQLSMHDFTLYNLGG